jgi:hypothetical protein
MVEEFKVEEASRRHDLRRQAHILFRGFRIPLGWLCTNAKPTPPRSKTVRSSSAMRTLVPVAVPTYT